MPIKHLTSLRAAAALCAALGLPAAQAHQVWLEQDAQGAKLYFGEYGDNLREVTPGLLDKFGKPTGHKLAGGKAEPLTLTKTPNGFALSARAARGETLIAEEATYPVSERKQGDKTTRSIYQPAARLVTVVDRQEPVLTLDLVPTGPAAAGKADLQAFYKGKPLAKAKVAVVTASGWAQEHHTDEAGRISVSLPWRGTYVLELSHNDTTGGERAGEKWDRASYVTSLTLEQADGLAALPPSPPATPNK